MGFARAGSPAHSDVASVSLDSVTYLGAMLAEALPRRSLLYGRSVVDLLSSLIRPPAHDAGDVGPASTNPSHHGVLCITCRCGVSTVFNVG